MSAGSRSGKWDPGFVTRSVLLVLDFAEQARSHDKARPRAPSDFHPSMSLLERHWEAASCRTAVVASGGWCAMLEPTAAVCCTVSIRSPAASIS